MDRQWIHYTVNDMGDFLALIANWRPKMATEPTPRQPDTWYTVTLNSQNNAINIRKEPAQNGARVGLVKHGDKLKYLHSPTALSPDSDTVKYTWHQVETLKGVKGWMALINNQTAEQQFTNAREAEPPPDPDDTQPTPTEYVTRAEMDAALDDLRETFVTLLINLNRNPASAFQLNAEMLDQALKSKAS